MQEVISGVVPKVLGRPAVRAVAREQTGDSIILVRRLSFILVLIGSGLQGYANGTPAAMPVAITFLVAGYLAITLAFPGKRSELRVFMLMYAMSVLAGGLAQCYSVYVFQDTQNFSDAVYFFGQISPKPPFKQWAELPTDTVLAIFSWQQLYAVAYYLGFKFGPYVAVMFNALVIGLSGTLTVGTARALFGDDLPKLRRVEILFALCGLFILFGSVLLRDSFVVFFNALWLWGVVRYLTRPAPRSLVFAASLTVISIYAMLYLRDEMVMLFGVYIFLAVLAWYCARKLNATRIMVVLLALGVTPIADTYITGFLQDFRDTQTTGQQNYQNLGAVETGGNSLGNRLVAEQPLPIRLIMGAGTLVVNPIPLWGNFKADASEYHIIEGYHGIYLVLIIPLGIAGLIGVARQLRAQGRTAIPLLFLVAYLLVNLAAIAASSRLVRHLGQFMAALTILAALPNLSEKSERKLVRTISIGWFAGVVLIHVAWAAMR